MRASSRWMLVVAAIAALIVPLPAQTAVSSCQDTFVGDDQCTFYLAGDYLQVTGLASTRNLITVTISDAVTGRQLLACASHQGHCVAEKGITVTGGIANLPAGIPLSCRVDAGSTTTGLYHCYSAA